MSVTDEEMRPRCRLLFQAAVENDVRGEEERNQESGQEAEREERQGAHAGGLGVAQTGRGDDDKHQVDEAEGVPNRERAVAAGGRKRHDQQQERGGGDNDIADAGRDGEGVGQHSTSVQKEQINADETHEVQRDERADVGRIEERARRGHALRNEERESGERGDQDGHAEVGEARNEAEGAGEKRGEKPNPEGQAQADAGKTGIGAHPDGLSRRAKCYRCRASCLRDGGARRRRREG